MVQFGPARIMSTASQRIVCQDAVLPGDDIAFRIEAAANHARSDATNVEASQLRFAKEEAVDQAHRIAARTGRILEAVDVAAFDAGRKNEAAASQGEIFDGAGAGTKIFDAAAQAGEVLVENQPFALRKPKPIVTHVVDQRIADRGGGKIGRASCRERVGQYV